MDQKIKKILQDIYLTAPGLTDNEEELKKTIEKLLGSKPGQEIDPGFKQELLDKILVEYGKPGPQHQIRRPFYLRPAFITAAAASLIVAALGIQLFLSKRVTKPSTVITVQGKALKSEVRKTKAPVKPKPGKRPTTHTRSPKDEEKLRSLGYLGGDDTGIVSTGTGVSLPRQRHSYQYQSDANTEPRGIDASYEP